MGKKPATKRAAPKVRLAGAARPQKSVGSTRNCTDAPLDFIGLRGGIHQDKELFERICAQHPKDHPLNDAWRKLAKFLPTSNSCLLLWSEIQTAYRRARRAPLLQQRRAAVREIAAAAESLRAKVDGDSDFDLLAYDFFPDEMLQHWERLGQGDDVRLRHQSGPTLAELLVEVRDRALALEPQTAMRVHLGASLRARVTQHELPATFFALKLDAYFRRAYGKPLTTVVGAVARAAFKLNEDWSAQKAIANARRKGTQ